MLPICKIFSFFFFSNLGTADSLPKQIGTGLDNWNKNHPSEKVFVHTDKATYVAGENIWYKAFVTLEGMPTILSKIVYIELVDDKGKVVEKQMRPITSGAAAGDINLPKNLPTGNYSLSAYSLWMLNYKPFLFKKNIRIYNSDFKPSDPKKGAQDFAVAFFPEGGEMIEGLKSTVAFYATNKNGLPVSVTGSVIDGTGKNIAAISTTHSGYGKFEIVPTAGGALTATLKANGFEKTFKLPTPKKEGVTLTVNNTNATKTFVQLDRVVSDKSKYNELLVVAQMFGKPAFMGMANFSEDATGMAIPKKNLPPGIMHITVFDLKGIPLAERLVFVNNYELTGLGIATDSLSLKTRGKNKFKIDLSKFTGPSVSFAITDADLTNTPGTEENILSALLLTSDLKGYIHQPGYYFQNKGAEVTDHLDLLMITHGWRRFKWDDVVNNKDIALKYPVESAISISGKVTIPQSTKTIAGGHVDIITKGEDSTTILSKAVVNNKGEFFINDLNFKQGATVYLQGSKTSNQNANVDIVVHKAYVDTLNTSANVPTIDLDTLSGDSGNKLLTLVLAEAEKNKEITLAGVTVKAKRVSRMDSLNSSYASDLFQMGQSLEVASTHYISIWQFLREQVSGLTVEGSLTDPQVFFNRMAGLQAPATSTEEEGTDQAGNIASNGITYYLNEINVSKDVINTLHPGDVALIKVFKGPEGAALGMN
ncbi:MAG TPA: MG2 domain-containing protein, partial [Flavisolibacter sp.]|nr:MG2 domain-containing protein [Flavisolibacter sp.]